MIGHSYIPRHGRPPYIVYLYKTDGRCITPVFLSARTHVPTHEKQLILLLLTIKTCIRMKKSPTCIKNLAKKKI